MDADTVYRSSINMQSIEPIKYESIVWLIVKNCTSDNVVEQIISSDCVLLYDKFLYLFLFGFG